MKFIFSFHLFCDITKSPAFTSRLFMNYSLVQPLTISTILLSTYIAFKHNCWYKSMSGCVRSDIVVHCENTY